MSPWDTWGPALTKSWRSVPPSPLSSDSRLFMADPGLVLLKLGDLVVPGLIAKDAAWCLNHPKCQLTRTFYSSWQTQCFSLDWQTRYHTRFLFGWDFKYVLTHLQWVFRSLPMRLTDTQTSCTARPKVVHAIEGQGIVHNYFIKNTFGKYLFTMDFTKEELTLSTVITPPMLFYLSCLVLFFSHSLPVSC